MDIIKVSQLHKSFGQTKALRGVSFRVRTGSITGFLGPNGAGKSTAINILLGFIAASSGQVKVFGKNVSADSTDLRRDIGFLSSNMALDKTLTAGQEIEYFAHLSGRYDPDYIQELAQKLGLDLTQKIGRLSTGNHQKVALIIALLGQPKLLILDEPTAGLDPLVQAEFNKLVLNLRDQGSTVFISSHVLSEIDELCDEFIFIKDGRVVAQLDKKALGAQASEQLLISPTAKNRAKILQFLRKNHIRFERQTGDLGATFMRYYSDNEDKNA